MDDGSWILWLLAGAVALGLWPTPEDRELRRQVRKLDRARRERERLLREMGRGEDRFGRGRGDWL